MNIPTPKTWTAGQWSTAEMNVHMRDVLGFFLNLPLCIVRKERASQSVGASHQEPITWDTVIRDNDGMFGTDTVTFTCRTPGYYLLTCQVQYDAPTAPGDSFDTRTILIRQFSSPGTLVDYHVLLTVEIQAQDESYSGSCVMALNAGDYVVVYSDQFAAEDAQIVGYDPSKDWYGCQMDFRWLTTL